mmetsp:Transcript_22800/g.36717  ORF Transcript_22800/g.36717 Transcript_22800/m.36717 type:complete len:204 (-) Transcript_22800:187-798(-)
MNVLESYDISQPLYIGERYGYAHRASEGRGYDYITMGGGLVLSTQAILMRNKCLRCVCPYPDTPDDMQLGLWMKYLGIPAHHESGFHQSEPNNYHRAALAHYASVSFHRFQRSPMTGEIDPEKTHNIFETYLGERDNEWKVTSGQARHSVEEAKKTKAGRATAKDEEDMGEQRAETQQRPKQDLEVKHETTDNEGFAAGRDEL